MSSLGDTNAKCLNCGAELHGAYCHACGQRHRDGALSFRELLSEAAEEIVGFGRRFVVTLLRLLLRPGAVTAGYLAGRRARFASPLRLYLTASVALGAALVFADTTVVVSLEGAAAPDRSLWLRYWLWTVLFMMPVFAGLLRLVLPGGRSFSEHVVFAMHFHTVVYILAAIVLPLVEVTRGGPVEAALALSLPLAVLVHFVLALRRVYGVSPLRAGLTAVGMGVVYGAIQLVALIGTGVAIDAVMRVLG